MATGTVKFYNEKSKFGFIIVDETKEEIYVAESGLKSPIKDNDKVSFDIIPGRKTNKAINVTKTQG